MSPSLPPELWRSIFQYATYVPFLLNTEWDYEPSDRIWEGCTGVWGSRLDDRVKRAIVQVCRQWKEIGSELLYEVIRLQSLSPYKYDRLGVLVDIFKASSASGSKHGYGWWTKRIECYGGLLKYLQYAEKLFSLLELCHNLEIFSISRDSAPTAIQTRLAHILQSRFSHSLRRLEFRLDGDDEGVPIPHALILPNIRITSLCITVRTEHLDYALPASIEDVNTLTLDFPSPLYKPLIDWFFPRLRTLSLCRVSKQDLVALSSFIEQHHSTLNNLLFTSRRRDGFDIIAPHPNIRALTLSRDCLGELGYLLGKKQGEVVRMVGLTHLGILSWWQYTADFCAAMVHVLERQIFPNLRIIRFLNDRRPDPTRTDAEDWSRAVELCRGHNVRLEDRNGLEVKY